MNSLPVKIRLVGKNKVAVIPKTRETSTDSGIFLSTINTVLDYQMGTVVEVSQDVMDVKKGDTVIVNWKKGKETILTGYDELFNSKYSVSMMIFDIVDDVLAVYEE